MSIKIGNVIRLVGKFSSINKIYDMFTWLEQSTFVEQFRTHPLHPPGATKCKVTVSSIIYAWKMTKIATSLPMNWSIIQFCNSICSFSLSISRSISRSNSLMLLILRNARWHVDDDQAHRKCWCWAHSVRVSSFLLRNATANRLQQQQQGDDLPVIYRLSFIKCALSLSICVFLFDFSLSGCIYLVALGEIYSYQCTRKAIFS